MFSNSFRYVTSSSYLEITVPKYHFMGTWPNIITNLTIYRVYRNSLLYISLKVQLFYFVMYTQWSLVLSEEENTEFSQAPNNFISPLHVFQSSSDHLRKEVCGLRKNGFFILNNKTGNSKIKSLCDLHKCSNHQVINFLLKMITLYLKHVLRLFHSSLVITSPNLYSDS